jgi:hypothetical protein
VRNGAGREGEYARCPSEMHNAQRTSGFIFDDATEPRLKKNKNEITKKILKKKTKKK